MKNTSKQLNQISNKHTISCDKNLIKMKKDLNRQFDHVSTHLFRSEYELFLLRRLCSIFTCYEFFDSIPNLQEIDELIKLNKTSTELLDSYRERI
jgi:hypothetical protein